MLRVENLLTKCMRLKMNRYNSPNRYNTTVNIFVTLFILNAEQITINISTWLSTWCKVDFSCTYCNCINS